MKSVLTDPNNPMYESVREQLPEELKTAIDRATAETTPDEITLEGLRAAVDGDVDIDKDSWVSALNEKLGDLATTEEVTADNVKIKVEQGIAFGKLVMLLELTGRRLQNKTVSKVHTLFTQIRNLQFRWIQ